MLKKMICNMSYERQELSDYIKNVHKNLRLQAQQIGAEEAWHQHCSKDEVLQRYASAMHRLATVFWEQQFVSEDGACNSRIYWVASKCIDYFVSGRREQENLKEKRKLELLSTSCDSVNLHFPVSSYCETVVSSEASSEKAIMNLLDVGSCYNPFKHFTFFNTIALDIAPACEDVMKCDFLEVEVVDKSEGEVELPDKLRAESFDVVVFSLLLEYLPSPSQRYACCCKAYSLLHTEGLLFIITPDSKHPTANASLIKSWRVTLASMGFSRVYYQKLTHLHCMAFRKDINPSVSKHWASKTNLRGKLFNSSEIMLNIPQDFQENLNCDETDVANIVRSEEEDTVISDMFLELPEI